MPSSASIFLGAAEDLASNDTRHLGQRSPGKLLNKAFNHTNGILGRRSQPFAVRQMLRYPVVAYFGPLGPSTVIIRLLPCCVAFTICMAPSTALYVGDPRATE